MSILSLSSHNRLTFSSMGPLPAWCCFGLASLMFLEGIEEHLFPPYSPSLPFKITNRESLIFFLKDFMFQSKRSLNLRIFKWFLQGWNAQWHSKSHNTLWEQMSLWDSPKYILLWLSARIQTFPSILKNSLLETGIPRQNLKGVYFLIQHSVPQLLPNEMIY